MIMSIRMNQLSFGDQLRFGMLSKKDQIDVLNCKTIEEAVTKLNNMKKEVRLDVGSYEPKLQVSGSSVKYKTKNLFTEIFDEQDVKDFMVMAEMSSVMDDEIILGELKRKMSAMSKEGKQPLQCMVYATKQNEKVFYNNEKKVAIWAQAIAESANSNLDSVLSINHMLVNWGIWKRQIMMLITACGYIKKNEKLDEVIRDLYVNYDDDKVKYTVIKRLLHGLNEANYRAAFAILKNADFIGADTDRKYFNILKKKVENASPEEREALYAAFRGTQGFGGAKRKRIDALFAEKEESELVKKINESKPEQKDVILKEVYNKVYGTQKDYREVAKQARDIILYKNEIQEMFMKKIDTENISIEDIKVCGLAVGNLDSNGKAIPFLEEQMSLYNDDEKQIMFAYVLAILSDNYINLFINKILDYDGNSVHTLLSSVRNLNKTGKNQVARKYLYENCLKIKEKYGVDSSKFKNALRNIGEFLQVGNTVAIYDIKFDQMLFDFLGYNKASGIIEGKRCTARNVLLVLGILENVMDKNNYEGRYQKFMWDMFAFFKETNIDIANRIDEDVKQHTGQGIPSM